MRILYWVQRFWPHIGGVEVHATRFLPEMRKRGFECAVLTSPGERDLPARDDFHGIPVHRLRFEEAITHRDPAGIVRMRGEVTEVLHTFRPDLVHLHLTDASVLFHLLTRAAHPCPMLLSLRVTLEGELNRADSLLFKALSSADWITANSAAVLAGLREQLPSTASRSSVVLDALDPSPLAPTPLPFTRPVLLLLGRVVHDKGFDLALEALPAILHRHPQAQLVVAGAGPALPQLKAFTSKAGLEDHVRFLGWVAPERIPELINTATLVLVPSRWREAFGLVALQAASQARPVIAARVGGLPEVVAEGETGLLVPKEDPAALAGAVLQLLSDPDRAIRLGEQGRWRARDRFSWEAHLDAFASLYRRFGDGKG
jgi:glycogen(starch) synthase